MKREWVFGVALLILVSGCGPSASNASKTAAPEISASAEQAAGKPQDNPAQSGGDAVNATRSEAEEAPASTDGPGKEEHAEFFAKFDTPSVEKGDYGAIAVAAKGSVVYAGAIYGARNRSVAERAAVEVCDALLDEQDAASAAPCSSQVWFYGKCGGLATSKTGGWGTGYGDSPRQACAWAQKVCTQYGPDCEPALYVCSPGGKHGTCDGNLTMN